MARIGAAPHRIVSLACACAAVASGCHHLLEPIRPSALAVEEVDALPGPTSIRIENGYEAPEIRHVLDSGIHSLELDLRDWTARLVSELRYELDRRQAIVFVPPESLQGTSAAPGPLAPQSHVRPDETFKSLRVRVTEVLPPDRKIKRGPIVAARVESIDGVFHADYSAGSEQKGFSETLLDLKRRIVRDPDLVSWLVRKP